VDRLGTIRRTHGHTDRGTYRVLRPPYVVMTLNQWLRNNIALLSVSATFMISAGTGIGVMSAQMAIVDQQLTVLNNSLVRIETAMASERIERTNLQLDMRTAFVSIDALREGLASAWGQINRLSDYNRRTP